MTDLLPTIDKFLRRTEALPLPGEYLTEARNLLGRAHDAVVSRDGEIHQISADRDAAWRVANAASEGHAAIRTRYYDLAEKIGACETDSPSDIAHRLTVYVDRQTRNTEDALRSSERELDAARSEADQLRTLVVELKAGQRDVLAAHNTTVERLEREHGELMEKLAARAESGPADHQREIAELRALAAANAEVLQRQGNALAQLQVALLMAGAPKSGDLTAWASNVRNTILGQRREINELAGHLRNHSSAREQELREFQAAAEALPDVLKPTNRDNPYWLMRTPIEVFMAFSERALALVPAGPTRMPASMIAAKLPQARRIYTVDPHTLVTGTHERVFLRRDNPDLSPDDCDVNVVILHDGVIDVQKNRHGQVGQFRLGAELNPGAAPPVSGA